EADVIRSADGSTLRVTAPDAAQLSAFEGTVTAAGDRQQLEGPLSAANAAALREVFEVLRPRLIGEATTSVGTGDRLGLRPRDRPVPSGSRARAPCRCWPSSRSARWTG